MFRHILLQMSKLASCPGRWLIGGTRLKEEIALLLLTPSFSSSWFHFRFCRGCKIDCTEERASIGNANIAVDWDPTALHLRYQTSQERVKELCRKAPKNLSSNSKLKITAKCKFICVLSDHIQPVLLFNRRVISTWSSHELVFSFQQNFGSADRGYSTLIPH